MPLAVGMLSCLALAGQAAAHDDSIRDGRDRTKCKAPRCADIKSASIAHTSTKVIFRIATYRRFSTRSAGAPTVEIKVGARGYLLKPKGGSRSGRARFPVQVSRKNRRSIRYAVSLADLGSPTGLTWRVRIDKGGRGDRAPNSGLVEHGGQPGQSPAPQSRTKLTASGARATTFTDDGACSSNRDPSGDTTRRDWGGAWSTYADGQAWVLEVTLQREQYNGAGTYSFRGRTSEDDAPSLFTDHWVRFGDGALTAWETLYTPAATAGTITIAADLRSGTLDATLVNKEDNTEVRVSGPFYCDAFRTD